jgi:hypothetical protein
VSLVPDAERSSEYRNRSGAELPLNGSPQRLWASEAPARDRQDHHHGGSFPGPWHPERVAGLVLIAPDLLLSDDPAEEEGPYPFDEEPVTLEGWGSGIATTGFATGPGSLKAAAIPRAQLITLDGCGHAPHLRDPVTTNLTIRDFTCRPAPAASLAAGSFAP